MTRGPLMPKLLSLVFVLWLAGCERGDFAHRCFEADDTRLLAALEAGDLDRAERAITGGASLNAVGCEGITPAFWYFRLGNDIDRDVVNFIFDRGADPDSQAENGVSMMELAAKRSDPWLISALIERGGDPNLRNERSAFNTYPVFALISVLSDEKVEALRAFSDGGADLFLRTSSDMPLILRAINGSDFEMVVALLRAYPEMRCMEVRRGEFVLTFDRLVEVGVLDPASRQYQFREEAIEIAASISCSQ